MMQEELKKIIEKYLNDLVAPVGMYGSEDVEFFMKLINKHVAEVIGEDVEIVTNPPLLHRERLIAEEAIKASKDEQRKRAGITK